MNRFFAGAQAIGMPIMLLILACNLLVLCWYLFSGYQAIFHADSAIKVLLAREIVETGQYFPREWVYANGDIFVLFGHTFIIPLLAFLPAGFLAHAVSGFLSTGLILGSIWLVAGITGAGMTQRVAVLAVLASGVSGYMAENLFGQVSYGVFVYFSGLILFFSFHLLYAEPGRRKYYGIALFGILLLAAWSNPFRALVSFGVPVFAAILWNAWGTGSDDLPPSLSNRWVVLGVVGAGFLVGTLLYIQTLSGLQVEYGAGRPKWLSYDEMLRNLSLTPQSVLGLFGGLPTEKGELVSLSGVYEAFRLAAGVLLIGMIPMSLRASLQRKGSGMAFVGFYTLTALAGVLFLQLTTTIPAMNDPIIASRYLVPSLVMAFVLVLCQPSDWVRSPVLSLCLAIVFACYLTSAYPALVQSGSYSNADRSESARRAHSLDGVKNYLLEQGLRYGYASFWNSGTLTVLSDEKLLVRHIRLENGIPIPDRWLCSDRWYRPDAWQGTTFLLLTEKEETKLNRELLERYHGTPIPEMRWEGFRIFVLSENPAVYLPGWGRQGP